MRTRVSIAMIEQDSVTRKTLVRMLRTAKWARVQAVYADAAPALRRIPHTRPDIVLVDLQLPGALALECVRVLKAEAGVKVVALARSHNLERVFQAFAAGADACLSKEDSGARFVASLRDFYHGGSPLCAKMASEFVAHFRENNFHSTFAFESVEGGGDAFDRLSHDRSRHAGHEVESAVGGRQKRRSGVTRRLTAREREILRHLASGLLVKEIGGKLRIAGSTVNDHLKNIYRKLGVHSRAQAVASFLNPANFGPPR